MRPTAPLIIAACHKDTKAPRAPAESESHPALPKPLRLDDFMPSKHDYHESPLHRDPLAKREKSPQGSGQDGHY